MTGSNGFGLGCLTGSTGFGLGCLTGSTGLGLGCLTGSTDLGLGCLTGSTGLGLGCLTGSTGLGLGCLTGSTGLGLGCLTGSTGLGLDCLTGSTGLGLGCLTGLENSCLAGWKGLELGCLAVAAEGGGEGFVIDANGFGDSYFAAMAVTGEFELGCLVGCGETLLTVAGVGDWEGLLGTEAVEEDTEGTETPTCFCGVDLPKVTLGSGGTTPLELVFTLGLGLGDLVVLRVGFFTEELSVSFFWAGLPYVVLGRGGTAPPENTAEALVDNLGGWGLGGRFVVGDF